MIPHAPCLRMGFENASQALRHSLAAPCSFPKSRSLPMNLDRWRRIRELSEAAAGLPAAERRTWLESVESDADLLARALALIEESESDSGSADPPGSVSPQAIAAAVEATVGSLAWCGRRIGAWRLVELVGRGGMGEVWRAERIDGGFRQDAALKLMRRSSGDASYLARFEAERQILARLEHQHIARLLDGGTLDDGQPWLALEYVRGTDLISHADQRRLGVRERIALFLDVCAAVAHAHRFLIVHRDLKPSNVMVTDDARVKLLDFGIAKLLPGAEGHLGTDTAAAPLTPAYATPEQLKREPVSTQTDVYALGLLLHELVTGVLPHRRRGSQSAENLVEILTREPPPASTALERHVEDSAERARIAGDRAVDVDVLRGALRGDLDAIIGKALRTRPEDRYASVDALAGDLGNHLERRPVSARRGSLRYRSERFVARHRMAVGLAGLLAVSVVGGITSMMVQSRVVARERDRALIEGQRAAAALAFQREIFRRARPANHLGKEPGASQLLDLGENMLAENKALEPSVRATLIEELSRSRGLLGSVEHAYQLGLSAQSIFESIGDRRGVMRLDIHLGSLANILDRHEEARERIDRVLAAPSGVLPPGELYAAWYQHGILIGNAGDVDGADQAITTALELAGISQAPAPAPIVVAGMEVVRAGFLSGAGRADEALARLRSTRDRLADRDELDDATHHQLMNGEALALELLNRLDEAEEAIERRLALSQRIWGPTHYKVANDLEQLARLALKQYRLSKAISHVEQALPIAHDTWGHRSSNVAYLLQTLALARLRSGDADGAAQAASEALEIRRQVYHDQDSRVLNSWASKVLADEAAGRIDAALAGAAALRTSADSAWMRLSLSIRMRLDALGIYHRQADVAARCSELAALRDGLQEESALQVASLYLGACLAETGDSAGAAAALADVPTQVLDRMTGDPALARLRAAAQGR
jgi:serine/threonine-protein kinase